MLQRPFLKQIERSVRQMAQLTVRGGDQYMQDRLKALFGYADGNIAHQCEQLNPTLAPGLLSLVGDAPPVGRHKGGDAD